MVDMSYQNIRNAGTAIFPESFTESDKHPPTAGSQDLNQVANFKWACIIMPAIHPLTWKPS